MYYGKLTIQGLIKVAKEESNAVRADALFAHVSQDGEDRKADYMRKLSDIMAHGENDKKIADVWMSAHWLGKVTPSFKTTVDVLKQHVETNHHPDVLSNRLTELEKRLKDTGSLWNPNKQYVLRKTNNTRVN